ncbi:MAG: heavy-metal-associated domain-containing protein [Bacteroidales bacterium]|nr:heavy-metal-associated domain-containing protein [Bacteroidales bacterium]MCK5338463.1 heavy-metal-associated domain-containing protein [Bacteroidales bacterium]
MKKISFLLILVLIVAACNNTANTDQTNTDQTNTDNTEAIQQEAVIEVAIITVSGMNCGGCETTIAGALNEIDGVMDAKASFTEQQAKVKFDSSKADIEEFKAAIEGKGYTVESIEVVEYTDQSAEPTE